MCLLDVKNVAFYILMMQYFLVYSGTLNLLTV